MAPASRQTLPGAGKFPYRSLVALGTCLVANGVCAQQLFTYAGFLVVHYGLATRDTAGFYAGYLAGTFMLGRTLASFPLGMLADKWGRKPVIYISCASLGLGSLGFAFSPNFACALGFRLVLGLLNGINGVAKTMVSELCTDPNHETRAMAVITTSWYLSMLVAPALGGALYGHGIAGSERMFPQMLPNLVTVVLVVCGTFCACAYLPETLPGRGNHRRRPKSRRSSSYATVESEKVEEGGSSEHDGEDAASAVPGEAQRQQRQQEAVKKRPKRWRQRPKSKEWQLLNRSDQGDEEEGPNGDGSAERTPSSPPTAHHHHEEEEAEEKDGNDDRVDTKLVTTGKPFLNREFRWLLVLYCLYSLAVVCVDETISLWAIASPDKGGLGWDANRLGAAVSAVAVLTLLFSVFVYTPVTNLLGKTLAFAVFSLAGAPAAVLLPIVATLSDSTMSSTSFGAVVLVMFFFRACGSVCFACVALMVNHSVSTEHRGRANGLNLTVGSLARAVGPSFSAPLFAWSINDSSMPWLVFALSAAVMMVCGLGTFAATTCAIPRPTVVARTAL